MAAADADALRRSASGAATVAAHVVLVAHAAVYCLDNTRTVACPAVTGAECRGGSAHVTFVAVYQGLKLVHFSAQRKRFLWNRECI